MKEKEQNFSLSFQKNKKKGTLKESKWRGGGAKQQKKIVLNRGHLPLPPLHNLP